MRALPIWPQRRSFPDDMRPAGAVDLSATPSHVVWELTLRCDLACEHCGSRALAARDDELSTDEALVLADQIAAIGTREVSLNGGEAYLHPGWLEIVRRLTGHGIRVGAVSGGFGLTKKRLAEAKRAGLDTLNVSVDGPADLHDRLRGRPGSHASAMRAIAFALDVGIRVGVNTQISKPGLRQTETLLMEVLQHRISGWQMSLTVAMGRAADRPELLLQPYQVLEAIPLLARLKRWSATDHPHVRFLPGNNIGYFGPYEAELQSRFSGGRHSPCNAGVSLLGIESNGGIKGCPGLPSAPYVGGSVRERPLEDIWRTAPALRFARRDRRSDLWGFCGSCYHADECLAGCSWTSHSLFGRIGNNPYCHHRALELLVKGRRERLVKTHDAPGQPFDHGRFDCVEEAWPPAELPAALRLAATGEGELADAREA